MKQYTTPEQTAKLIELGFEKPCSIASVEPIYGMGGISVAKAYSIGEMIEMLPEVTCRSNNDDIHYYLTIYNDAMVWNIAYRDGDDELCYIFADELIDALYDMVIKLKEEGVI
jgi:hypothetical protein